MDTFEEFQKEENFLDCVYDIPVAVSIASLYQTSSNVKFHPYFICYSVCADPVTSSDIGWIISKYI